MCLQQGMYQLYYIYYQMAEIHIHHIPYNHKDKSTEIDKAQTWKINM